MRSIRVPLKKGVGVLNIAHRGARAFAPENTLVAFEKAKCLGSQMFEIDVRLSKDGALVVHHDETLSRCTDVQTKFPRRDSYYVWDFTVDELMQLDAGSWYIKQLMLPSLQRQAFLQTLTEEEAREFVTIQARDVFASGNIKIPTLKQTLEFAVAADMMVNIELKPQPGKQEDLVAEVVKLVEWMRMEHKILISSFDHPLLRALRQLNKTIAIGVLTSQSIMNLNEYLESLDADAYHPAGYSDGDVKGLQKLKLNEFAVTLEAGWPVNVWTCNNKEDIRQLVTCGVSGVISDFPNRVKEVIDEFIS